MDERDLRRVGEQVEPGGRAKAPGRLELLQRFINTHNHDLPADWDRIGAAAKAHAWLRGKRLISGNERVSEADAARLRELREALRTLALANHGGKPDGAALDIIDSLAARAPLTVVVSLSAKTSLKPARGGVDGAMAVLLGIFHEAQLTGDWPRLKGCRQCGYAFYDRSKNRSAAWCAMSICGNRTKNRAYYERRRQKASAPRR
jgi:predicted RNA-binding Zn ribbon-like protein